MDVQEQGSSQILIELLLQPSQAAGGVTGPHRGPEFMAKTFFNHIVLAKEHLTPTCVEVSPLIVAILREYSISMKLSHNRTLS